LKLVFTIPNIISLARLLLVPCFIFASMRGMYTTAFVLFVSAAVTDSLDGMVARRWNMRSTLGAVLDPAADKILMVCGFLYYTFAHTVPDVRIPGWLTFSVFIRDFLIVTFAYLMYTRVHVSRFPPTALGKSSTVLQAIALGATIAANAFLPVLIPAMPIIFRASMLMTLISGWHYMYRARRILYELSPAAA
jgi:cardiolipin synthase